MYLYETHCHTKRTSACSRLTADDIVEVYLKNGYTGVFITDHFINGNTTVDRSLPYGEQIREFCRGYREVKERAAGKLEVYFGLEYSYGGTDILVYGWEEEQLREAEDFMRPSFSEFGPYCAERGLLAVHAHPFREADYIDHVCLTSNIEAIETYNAARSDRCNRLGEFYAKEYGKAEIGGSDLHSRDQKFLSGMGFETKLTGVWDFVERVRRREGIILKVKNVLA